MEQYIVILNHEYGTETWLVNTDHTPKTEEILEKCGINIDPNVEDPTIELIIRRVEGTVTL